MAIENDMLLLPSRKGMVRIAINTIIRIEAKSNYSKLFFSSGKTIVVAKVLRWFESCLRQDDFIRVHRAHLVNKLFIRQYITGSKGKIDLTNGDSVGVSRRRKNGLAKNIKKAA